MQVTTELVASVLVEVESAIISRYGRKLVNMTQRFDSDDLVQMVAVKAIRSVDSCKAQSMDELRHWVLLIARSVCQDALKSHRGAAKRSTKCEQVAIGVATDDSRDGYQPSIDCEPAELAIIAEDCQAIAAALESIPATQAAAVRMRYVDGLEYDVIASELGVSINSVRLLVSRGLKAVRELVA